MEKLNREDLHSLEDYAEFRAEFRNKTMAHKQTRQVPVGPNATLYFEDRKTIQYQIQEMLRVERIYERKGIEEELAAYNPLIPDGSNLKATFMLEYSDPEERRKALAELVGIEHKVWMRVEGFDAVSPISNEDLDRSTEEKTASVHFLRFEFTPEMISALKDGATLSIGIEHANYHHQVEPVPETIRASLAADFG